MSSGHVMISYCWKNKDIVWKIEEALRTRGINTWIDKSNIGSELYEGMAAGVDGANAVILCISDDYCRSENCEREAKYAGDKKKVIIPIKLERASIAPWIKLLIAGKIYISFSDGDSGEKFNENIESLTKNLKDQPDDDLRIDGEVRAAVSDTPHTRVTEDNLDTVVDNIGKDWKRLGRKLGITDPDLDVLQMNNSHDVKEAIRQMLRQWREDNGKMATKEKLKEALVNAKRRDIADEIL
ncbi:uncharacterized protein [Ptychodera flava]|uniref:uncharacterized protein n=1 Tax=Ptychodera flava TaxID=63121 RepID=UPI00396A3CB0